MEDRIKQYKTEETYVEIKRLFLSALKAYAERAFTKLKDFETNALINKQTLAYESYKKLGAKEVIQKITVKSPTNIEVKIRENQNIVVVADLEASLERYVIDEKTDSIIEGVREKIGTYNYRISLIENENTDSSIICENCGATIEKSEDTCPYCHVVNSNRNNRLLIADISEVSMRDILQEANEKYKREKELEMKNERLQEEMEKRRNSL